MSDYYFTYKPEPRKLPVMEADGLSPKKDKDGNMILEEAPAVYEGEVKVRGANAPQRMKYMREINVGLDSSGEISDLDSISRTEKLFEIAGKHIEDVNLKRVDDGYEIKSFDELSYDSDCLGLVTSIANKILTGVKLGKELKRS